MITLHRSAERGHAHHGWLNSFHSFSFADYHNPARMGWGNLRVINEDRIAPGTGVRHSEFNHAPDATTHFLQIWLLPDRANHTPGYEQRDFPAADKRGRLRLVADPAGRDGAVTLHADARLWVGLFDGPESAELALDAARKAYVFLVRGSLQVNGQALLAGDALAIGGETGLQIAQGEGAEVLVFDLAP